MTGMLGCRDNGDDARNARVLASGEVSPPDKGTVILIGRRSHGDVLHSHASAQAPRHPAAQTSVSNTS